MKRLERKTNAGFTLIEIMLVIIIIVALMAVLIPNVRTAMNESKVHTAEMEVNIISGELARYNSGNPPTTQQGLRALVEKPTIEPIPRRWVQIREEIKPDPWNSEYLYEYPGKHNKLSFDVYSAGPDKVPGTDDDIGNWK